jgi:transposase InsO family protein
LRTVRDWSNLHTLESRLGSPETVRKFDRLPHGHLAESPIGYFRSPWQNGVAERWVGSCRRDLLDHVIVFGDRHLKRLLSEYGRYYHDDRTHLGLAKAIPLQRKAAGNHDAKDVLSQPRLGGLHHRYDLAA